jgi:hypothetical protein
MAAMIYTEQQLRRMHATILAQSGEPLIDGGWHIDVGEDDVGLVWVFYLDMEPGTKPLTIKTELTPNASVDA